MRPQIENIRLGDRQWQVRPLTLRQVQDIEPIVTKSALESQGNVSAAMAIVAIALRRDHPEAAMGLCDIEATAPEIGAAMAAVLRLGGFLDPAAPEERASGEAEAGVMTANHPPASTSALSTRDS